MTAPRSRVRRRHPVRVRRCVLHLRTFNCGDWSHGDRVARDAKAVTCYRCRRERDRPAREAAKARAARSAAIRRPPQPPHDEPGRCRLCGTPVSGRRRTWCSDDCVDLWAIASSPAIARQALVGVLGRICWSCGIEPGTDVDHIRPLWSLGPEERQQLKWWLPFNLQLLGPACHKKKTAREARERALARRAA